MPEVENQRRQHARHPNPDRFKETGRLTVVTIGLADTVRALGHVVAGAMAKGRGQLKGAKGRHQQCTLPEISGAEDRSRPLPPILMK